ncbi:hypothetical protein EYZ11_000098 [Aspergillus tanneri]|nr:hypothetical protein EYZ11_000098 [Aspergillus tanneri]
MHGGSRGQIPNQNPNHNVSNAWGESRDQLAAASGAGGPAQEPHVPVRGFNAAEAKGALRRAPKPFFYKTGGKDANNRPSGPWGSKPNAMANGKDFFLELRKQVTTLKQDGNIAGG